MVIVSITISSKVAVQYCKQTGNYEHMVDIKNDKPYNFYNIGDITITIFVACENQP